MTRHEHDIPVVRGSFSVRSPRAVALLHPFQLPLVFALAVLSVVFTVAPETLNHTPISFETRGVVHHIWHYYILLPGALLATVGMFVTHRRRLQVELSGLSLLAGALAMNLVAVIAEAVNTPAEEASSGLGMALRAAVVVGLLARAYTVAREPTVAIPGTLPNERR